MHNKTIPSRFLNQELRSLLATLEGLTDHAQAQGDTRTASILHNTALLLAVALTAAPAELQHVHPSSYAAVAQSCGAVLA